MTRRDDEVKGDGERDDHADGDRWASLHLWELQPVRDVFVIAAAWGLLLLGYRLSLVTVPLLLAMLLAYLFEPVVKRMTRLSWVSRQGAAMFIIVAAGLLVVIPATVGVVYGVGQGVELGANAFENAKLLDQTLDDRRTVGAARETWTQMPPALQWLAGELRPELELKEAPTETLPDETEPAQAAPRGPPDDAAEPQEDAAFEATLRNSVRWLGGWARENSDRIGNQVFTTSWDIVTAAVGAVGSVGSLVFSAFLTAFFFFFLSTGFGAVLEFWQGLIPERRKGRVIDLARKMDAAVAGFIRGRLTICAILCVVLSFGYLAIGAKGWLLLGIGVGILSLVPYLSLIGIPLGIAVMLLDPVEGFRGAWWWAVLGPILLYAASQALDDYLLTPWIQGRSTDLDTPTILFASIAGGVMAGFYGVLVAIPVAACLKIAIKELVWPHVQAWARGDTKDPLPIGFRDRGGGDAAGR